MWHIYTYGVGSSLLVSMNRVSSKTSGSGTGNSEGSTLLVYETSVSAYFPIITSGKGPKDSLKLKELWQITDFVEER
jgi:hypothetical protein